MRNRVMTVAVSALVSALIAVGCLSYAEALPGRGATPTLSGAAPDAPAVGPGAFQPLNPLRVLNTVASPSLKLGPGKELTITMPATVPAHATTVSLGVTALRGTANTGHLTVYPTGTQRPSVSHVEYAVGKIVNNIATVKLGTGRKVTIFNSAGSVDVIIDLHGYYQPPLTGVAGYLGWVRISFLSGVPTTSYTVNGKTPIFSKVEAGFYRVTFDGIATTNMAFQVTAFGNTKNLCNVSNAGGGSATTSRVEIKCFDPASGKLADPTMVYVQAMA